MVTYPFYTASLSLGFFVVSSFLLVLVLPGFQCLKVPIYPHLKWGKNESVLDWVPPKELTTKFPYYIAGFDLEHRPVFVIEFGRWDVNKIVKAGGLEYQNYQKYVEQVFTRIENNEFILREHNETGPGTVGIIFDMDGYNVQQVLHGKTIRHFLHDFSGLQFVQEHLAYAIILNADTLAHHMLLLARPILGSVTERLEVYGTQKHKWLPKILRKIGADQLPPAYGGSNPDYKPYLTFKADNDDKKVPFQDDKDDTNIP